MKTLLAICLSMSTLLMSPSIFAQTSVEGNGLQPLEATNGEVALDTLNIHLTFPVVHKGGIGLPLSIQLAYDSNSWSWTYVGGVGNQWVPLTTSLTCCGWNFPGLSPSLPIGGLLTSQSYQCTVTGKIVYGTVYNNYIDASGSVHAVNLGPVISPPTTLCPLSSASEVLTDGSGLTVSVNAAGGSVITPSGVSLKGYSIVDVNGNTISSSGGVITDTIGIQEVTITGSPSSGLVTYAYPTSTGTADVKVNFTNETLETNFGCTQAPYYTADFPATPGYYLPTSIDLPDGSSYSLTYEPSGKTQGATTGRIASITYPSGENISYVYSGVNCADGSPAGVTRTVTGDAVYQYSRNTSTWLSTTLVNDYGTGHSNNTNVYTFVAGSTNFLSQEVINQGTSTPLVTKVYCYNGNQTNCVSATAPSEPITQEDVYTTIAGMTTSSRVSETFDAYMNVTKSAVYDFGASTPTRQTVASGGPCGTGISCYGLTWNGSTTSPACSAIGSGVHSVPCQVQLENGSGATLRQTYFQYGTTTNPGSLLSKAVLTSGSNYLISSATYNANGTLATSKDANNNSTTYTEGACNNGTLTKVVPPLSTLDMQYSWDTGCNGAKMVSATDPNGFATSATYNDPFWRPTSHTDQLNNTLNTSYGYFPITVENQITFGSSDFDILITADPLGRPLYAQQIEGSNGSWDTIQMGYSWNSLGPVTTRTMPCATTKGAGCSNGTTTTTHDALGRPVTLTDGGGGTVSYTYSGSSSCTSPMTGCEITTITLGPAPTGEVVKKNAQEYNGLGQLMASCAISSSSGTTACGFGGYTGILTTYVYNSDGTVASVSRTSSTNTQTRSFTYDALGRTLTAAYPESGAKYFYYDTAPATPGVACSSLPLLTNSSPNGNLVKTYDANGTTACYSYDKMSRLTSVAYAGANFDGNNKYFVYDSATVNNVAMVNSLGRVAEAYTAPTSTGTKVTDEGFSYTARGEVSDIYQWSTNSNGYYHTTATYFANHALNTLSGVPGQSTWTYTVDGKGRLYSAVQGASTNMVGSTTYNAADQKCVVTLGLNDTDTYLYDGNTACTGLLVTGRMTSYKFSIGATPKTETGTLTWNANGTLRGLTVVDGINSGAESETCTYGTSSSAGYDEFGRLLQVNCVNGSADVWNQTFAYDPFDNITKSVPTGDTGTSWMPGYNETNNQYTLSGTTYDSNGNLLTDTFHTYTWNQDNHPKAVTDAAISMTYDAFGRMIEKKSGSSTYNQMLYSPIGPVAWMNKQNVVQFRMPLIGGDVGVTGINFFHADYLGSVPLVSSRGNRASVAARLFAPYGEVYNNIGITGDVNFTGDYQDLAAGTFDTPNRELNPIQGRWISPDPAHSGWNAYAYTTNPLGNTDPSGLNWQTVLLASYEYIQTLEDQASQWLDELEFANVPVASVNQNVSSQGNPLMTPAPGVYNVVSTNPDGSTTYNVSVPNAKYNPQDSNSPGWIFMQLQIPGLTYSTLDSTILAGKPMDNTPSVSQWRPPNPTDTVKAPYKPRPYKPSVAECFTSPGNAVDLMTEGSIRDNPDTPNSTPQIYQNTPQGTVSINSEAGEAQANFLAFALDSASSFLGCMAGAFF